MLRCLPLLLATGLVTSAALATAPAARPSRTSATARSSTSAWFAAGDVAAQLQGSQQRTDAALARRATLAAVAARADAARDAAAARVTQLKKDAAGQRPLEAALRAALEADEQAAAARSAVAGANAAVAREGAALLRLYDRLLADRRRAVDVVAGPRRADAVAAWRALVAQRDAVRAALAPALSPTLDDGRGASGLADLNVDDDDDVEALLEKSDLARDLEARLLRRAEAVRARIRELRDERAVADDVAGAVGRAQLFDEEDRRLLLQRDEFTRASTPGPTRGDGTTAPSPPGAPQAGSGLDASPGVDVPVGGTPTPTSATTLVTVERGYAATLDAAAVGAGSLGELQALEAGLQAELAALQQKQAALRGAARARAASTR